MVFPNGDAAEPARERARLGEVVVAVLPDTGFLKNFGVSCGDLGTPPIRLRYSVEPLPTWAALKSLHNAKNYYHPDGQSVVVSGDGMTVWLWLSIGEGGILLVGTDLAEDLLRFRQGDQKKAAERPTEPMWGIAGERPNYLFHAQLEGDFPDTRHADNWCMVLVRVLSERLKVNPKPILPGDAPGAIVITGDDDQAYLEKYAEQLKLLNGVPITYFLHPQTRHTPESLKRMLGREGIEVELHPDALDAPDQYGGRLDEQVAWFRNLVGHPPSMIRNHGFLNNGYWGHLPHWLGNGIRGSANLPGFDGLVLNGSLLPARLAYDGSLTQHWSMLTIIGDGIRFAGGYSDGEAAEKVCEVADKIKSSGIPGVMVLNLHPQNVAEAKGMHRAALEVIGKGFHAWNFGQCLRWFAERDGTSLPTMLHHNDGSLIMRVGKWLRRMKRV
jgi:hypothetical protein